METLNLKFVEIEFQHIKQKKLEFAFAETNDKPKTSHTR